MIHCFVTLKSTARARFDILLGLIQKVQDLTIRFFIEQIPLHLFDILAALRAARFTSVCEGSWLSIALGLAMIVLDIRKNLKLTHL